MSHILSFVNLKGGVGKTALAVNFSAECGRRGMKTLLVDVDPQTNATFSCMTLDAWQKQTQTKGSIADLFGLKRHTSAEGIEKTPEDVIVSDVFENVDLVPSHLDMFTMDLDLASVTSRERKLSRALSDTIPAYDIVVCDCPPNLTLPTQNAIAMSTHFAVPVSPDFLSGLGVGILLNRITQFASDMEHKLKHVGIILSRVGRPALHRDAIKDDIRETFGELVVDVEIKERVAVSEAAAQNKPVFDMGNASATGEFTAMADALLTKMGVS